MHLKQMATLVISVCLLLSTTVAYGHQNGGSTGSTPSKAVLDISFGQSQLFIKPTQRELAQDKDVHACQPPQRYFWPSGCSRTVGA